jgi:hypothetical protein
VAFPCPGRYKKVIFAPRPQRPRRLLVGVSDYYTGLDLDSFRVTADFPVDGRAAGQNLAPKFRPTSPGVWELKLSQPLERLAEGKIEVSVKDRQGNVARIERTFTVPGP